MAADITTPQQQHTLLNSGLGSSYNISFNFSSLFRYPSRFLAKFMNKGYSTAGTFADTGLMDATKTAWMDSSETLSTAATATMTSIGTKEADTMSASTTAFPGPWGFFSSGYMCGLLIMGVLMHRIDNIFVPTNTHMFHHHHPAHGNHADYGTRNRSFFNRFLPININRTSTRLAIHLPTLYLMFRVLLLWGIMLLQTADLFPGAKSQSLADTDSGNLTQNVYDILYRLGKWSASWETEDVCWHTFCAICAAFCVEGFVKGLDGNGHGFGFGFAEHMQANTSPFNLVGYAFLLHIYSSPLTHAFKPNKADYTNSDRTDSDMLPSRPDTHVLITLAIPLLQLTLFHLLSVRKRWSRHRMLPTALASMLSLAHFHVTLGGHLMGTSSKPSSYSSTTTTTTSSPLYQSAPDPLPVYTYTPHHTTHGYPILNYIPNIFETLLISTIFLTIFLNSLTQILITGRVDKPLLGLGISTGSGSGIDNSGGWRGWMTEMADLIPWEEDFGVVLLRVGTASLEATGLRGWGNEVGGVVASSLPSERSNSSELRKFGTVRLTRTGVVGVSSGSVDVIEAGGGRRGKDKAQNGKGRTRLLRGWNNEVREVDLGSDGTSRRRYGINGILTLNAQWFTELAKFAKSASAVLLGVVKMGLTVGWEVLRGRRKLFQRGSYGTTRVQGEVRDSRDAETSAQEGDEKNADAEEEEEVLYRKFLRGDLVSFESDEEDQDFDLPNVDQDDDDKGDEESSDLGEEVESDPLEETVLLYADLSNRETSHGPSTTETILAHMSYPGSSPLTRRRYASLHKHTHGSGLSSDDFSSFVNDEFDGNVPNVRGPQADSTSVGVHRGGDEFDEARRNCVICTTEARVIICWPCRCLAMCDSCRESLAARSSASKHRCPCCRRGVDGYSRIYIP
ncbi:hypothetical protein DFJ43DRAFT_70275 [Lentinula guzmanii]|uniref:RING-type domain-containing protein n=1 Tax=Lentinula guzmanii TaxID=2804957 RepID=A0AA38N3W7_9AGAR|nr:hypothetical protein DFJ43DRAFT_70275 [Lentinula guzmanii]